MTAPGTALARVLPAPALVEVDTVNVALSRDRAWQVIRHGDLGRSPLVRGLFWIRTVPGRVRRRGVKGGEHLALRIDDLVSTPDRPGFSVLVDDPPVEVVVGAIGKVWRIDIPFVHVGSAEAFAAFDEPGFVKVAWSIQLTPVGERATHVTFELRVAATDEASWRKFRRYFRVIGPGSRFVRRSLLSALVREHGKPTAPGG